MCHPRLKWRKEPGFVPDPSLQVSCDEGYGRQPEGFLKICAPPKICCSCAKWTTRVFVLPERRTRSFIGRFNRICAGPSSDLFHTRKTIFAADFGASGRQRSFSA